MAVMHTCRSFACSNRSILVTCRHGEISQRRKPLAAMVNPLLFYDSWIGCFLVAVVSNTAGGVGETSALVREIRSLGKLGKSRASGAVVDQYPLVCDGLLVDGNGGYCFGGPSHSRKLPANI